MKKILFFLLLSIFIIPSCSLKMGHVTKVGVSVLVSGSRTEYLIKSINQEAAKNNNLQFFYKINERDSQQQVLDIQDLMNKGIDILVVAPMDDPAVTNLLKDVHQKGIKIILLEGGGYANIEHYETKVMVDNYQVGKYIAHYLESLYHGKRADGIIVRGGSAKEFDTPRYDGIINELIQQNNDIQISFVLESDYTRDATKQVMNEYLNSRGVVHDENYLNNEGLPPICDFIYAFNCQMAAGIKDSFVSHNYSTFPFIIGVVDFDDDECISMVENSYIEAAVIYTSIGEQVYSVVEDIVNNNPIDSIITPPIFILDKDNISLYKTQQTRLGNKTSVVESMATQITYDQASISKQKFTIIVFLVVLIMAVLFSGYTIHMIRAKQRLLTHSEEQNIQIKKQIEELQEQKNQLVELSNKLEESTQAKLVFFTNISHEFKTPLSLISGPITDLVNRKDLSPEVHTSLDIIHRNSSRLNRLITELIDFRIYESDNIVINYSIGNVKDFLQTIASLFEDAFKRRNITFVFDAPQENDFIIPFDPIKLEKVFTNLLSNAFNHVKDNGQIRVSVRVEQSEKDKNLHLSVFNTDSYIPEELRKTIFRRFYTMDNSKGTGIGLALTTAIVDAFNGNITVKSDPKDGTTFLVDIPISDMLVTDAKFNIKSYEPDFAKLKLATIDTNEDETDIIKEMASLDKPIALIVEDNKDMRLYLRAILSNEYRILVSQNGNEGFEKAVKYRPGIIISDIFMPEKDGFQLCLDIRANEITKNIPILLLTASSSDEQRAKGYECGADAYLQKPFNDQTLKIRLKKLLEKHREVQEQIDFGFLPNISRNGLNDFSLQFLEKFRKYVEQHIDEDISVDDIAAYFSYSKSKLYRELREVTEYSPIDMVNLIRLKYAIDLMINQNKNITETAFMCGFTSASYFSRVFQKYYNERPLSYIKRLSNKK